jgi:hypothetical protein
MSKRWMLVLLVALLLVASASTAVFAARQASNNQSPAASTDQELANSPAQQAAPGAYRFIYSAKFVCGYQPPIVDQPGTPSRGEPVVKPGNYATEINIHNYNYREFPIGKKVIYLVLPSADGKDQKVFREPEFAGPTKFDKIVLGPDFATMDDCNRLWQLLYPNNPPPVPFPLMVGYLVVISPADLDVDVVYTAAAPGTVSAPSQSVSIDVERVQGKRTFVPQANLP